MNNLYIPRSGISLDRQGFLGLSALGLSGKSVV